MIKKLTKGFISLVQKFLPNPFIFAILLSGIVFVLGITINSETPYSMIVHWGKGFWGFLGFSMQMTLVVILGNALAIAPIFKRLVKRMAQIPKTPKQAVAFVSFVAGVSCMIQWGFGLVIGAILAKEVAKTVKKTDYRLLIAAAYSAFMLTVLTSSITLKAASNPDELVKVSSGVLTSVIPLAKTAYHPMTLLALLAMIITLPLLNAKMHPSEEETVSIDPKLLENDKSEIYTPKPRKEMTLAEKLENSRIITFLIFICGAVYIYYHFGILKKSLDIDIMNFTLFMFGILLHKHPMGYILAIQEATKNASGIILQFPFYAGIMGMMTGMGPTGLTLAGKISLGLVSVATKTTYPLFTWLSAAIVNMFVPSAGGQWAVQAPVMFPAGQALGVDPAITTMALCWGDTWTNMIQPFWALPALGIAGLNVRDIMGFCVMVFLWTGIIILLSLLGWVFFF